MVKNSFTDSNFPTRKVSSVPMAQIWTSTFRFKKNAFAHVVLRAQTVCGWRWVAVFIPILQTRKLTEIMRVILASIHWGVPNFKCSCWSLSQCFFHIIPQNMSSVELQPGSHNSKPPISCIRDSARPVCSERFHCALCSCRPDKQWGGHTQQAIYSGQSRVLL